jgi:hypothetical protein
MTTATWVTDGHRILIETSSKERVPVPAMDIFRAVFSRLSICANHTVRSPVEDISTLTFSRQPALPAVRLTGNTGSSLVLNFGMATDAGFVEATGKDDQLIHSGRWYPVRADLVASAFEWLKALGIHAGESITVGDLVALRAKHEKPVIVFDEVEFNASSQSVALHHALIPGFSGTLYPYQSSGVSFLSLVAAQGVGCILGDEMGLGKTAQVIAVLQIEKNSGRSPSLVIAPATLLENWRREICIFAPTLTVLLHGGAHRAGVAARLRGTDVVLVSYDTVRGSAHSGTC